MVAQIVSFVRREPQQTTGADWARDELAELYRIEHALLQAGLTLDVERGVTDEGDPWFVFCRPDGEVLIHLTRYDGLYRLHSSALPAPLIGRSFAALTKAFANQVPLQVTLQRDTGPRVFVHPAAMLAVVIGTIFVASNEVVFSTHAIDSEKKHGDASDPATAQGLKALLQSTFQHYIENFFTSLRDGTFFQQSTYITMIGTIAAFIVSSDTATTNVDHHARDWLIAGNHTALDYTNGPEGDSASVTAPVQASDVSHRTVETKSAIAQDASDQSQYTSVKLHTADAGSVGNTSTNPNTTLLQDDPVLGRSNDITKAPELLLTTSYSEFSGLSLANQTNPALADYSSVHSLAATPLSSSSSTSPVAATDPLKDLTTSVFSVVQNGQSGPGSTSEISNLVANAVQMNPAGGSQNLVTYFLNVNHISSQPEASPVAGPMPFDSAAAATLLSFLEHNPSAQAVFSNNSVVVYDSVNDTTPATVKIWDFPDGSTIAIVGHADHGFIV